MLTRFTVWQCLAQYVRAIRVTGKTYVLCSVYELNKRGTIRNSSLDLPSFLIPHNLGWRIETSHENIRREATQSLHGRQSNQSSALVIFERVGNLQPLGQGAQFLRISR
jgi:hypothetical protein